MVFLFLLGWFTWVFDIRRLYIGYWLLMEVDLNNVWFRKGEFVFYGRVFDFKGIKGRGLSLYDWEMVFF